jgi:hypothetical protein
LQLTARATPVPPPVRETPSALGICFSAPLPLREMSSALGAGATPLHPWPLLGEEVCAVRKAATRGGQ